MPELIDCEIAVESKLAVTPKFAVVDWPDARACEDMFSHSTVTLFARFLGLSTSVPRATAV